MSNKVKASFRDLTDNRKKYKKGDTYSHNDEERVAFLVGKGFLEENKKSTKKVTKPKKSEK